MVHCMNIVIADRMEPAVVEEIRKLGQVSLTPQDLKSALKGADVLIVRSATKVTKELLEHAPKLRVVASAGVGTDNIDSAACAERKIKVLNTPAASSNAVAELALCLMLSASRNVARADAGMKQGKWLKSELTGTELMGKTLGIMGLGRVGFLLASKAQALGMRILFYDPQKKEDADFGKCSSADALLSGSDFVSLHMPLLPETRGMISSDALSKMKKTAFLINTARGPLVDEEALYLALKNGAIAGACLDVYPQEPYSGKLCGLGNAV